MRCVRRWRLTNKRSRTPKPNRAVTVSTRTKNHLAILYGLPFVWVGIMHFVNPAVFEPIVPSYLGVPRFWVLLTGFTEIGVALGIMWPTTRRLACVLMIVQLLLLYLANLNMWWNDIPFDGVSLGTTGHLIRMAVQVLLIALAMMIGGLRPFGEAEQAKDA